MRRLTFFMLFAACAVPLFGATPVFKVYTEHDGVYGVTWEQLHAAGLEGAPPVDRIGLTNLGHEVPVWVVDGDGDGLLGPGERVEFFAEVLRGEHSYLNEFSRFNCYVLRLDDEGAWRGHDREATGRDGATPVPLEARHHIERDLIMARFAERPDHREEAWYWQRMSITDNEPFAVGLSIVDAERGDPEATASIRLGLRGWSNPYHRERSALPNHRIDVHVNGVPVEVDGWDGTDHHVAKLEVPLRVLADGDNPLEVSVPKRRFPQSDELLIDVILLNWVELEYPIRGRVAGGQRRFTIAGAPDRPVRIESDSGGAVALYTSEGTRIEIPSGGTTRLDSESFTAVAPGGWAVPDEVVLDSPSELRRDDQQADYIMITHRRLRGGTERLADIHRRRGLVVRVVDVQDVYDEFNHGIVDPRSLRDFLSHAWNHWREPAPRFVLLVGDASWDYKNPTADDTRYADWTYQPHETRRFIKNSSTPYAEAADLNDRNLVPTWSYPTAQGHAASDNWFVCLEGDDATPEMAIGRIPVVKESELAAVVEKTRAAVRDPSVGPWRRNLLFITNESAGFQSRSDSTADTFFERGYVPLKVYPHPEEVANEHHTQQIVDLFDDGLAAVHFLGHGGRYIWRTGPPDLKKNHDLFTLDHLEELQPTPRLPVVVSLTCYSGPFDHPTADSIGEKFLRIPNRGAVAVLAASWRNSPSAQMGEIILDELTRPGATVGEAIQLAKGRIRNPTLVQTYNLLGDPAVPTTAPQAVLEVEMERAGQTPVARIEVPHAGELLTEWIGPEGEVAHTETHAVEAGTVTSWLPESTTATAVRVYLWDRSSGRDAIGWSAVGSDRNVVADADADAGGGS